MNMEHPDIAAHGRMLQRLVGQMVVVEYLDGGGKTVHIRGFLALVACTDDEAALWTLRVDDENETSTYLPLERVVAWGRAVVEPAVVQRWTAEDIDPPELLAPTILQWARRFAGFSRDLERRVRDVESRLAEIDSALTPTPTRWCSRCKNLPTDFSACNDAMCPRSVLSV